MIKNSEGSGGERDTGGGGGRNGSARWAQYGQQRDRARNARLLGSTSGRGGRGTATDDGRDLGTETNTGGGEHGGGCTRAGSVEALWQYAHSHRRTGRVRRRGKGTTRGPISSRLSLVVAPAAPFRASGHSLGPRPPWPRHSGQPGDLFRAVLRSSRASSRTASVSPSTRPPVPCLLAVAQRQL